MMELLSCIVPFFLRHYGITQAKHVGVNAKWKEPERGFRNDCDRRSRLPNSGGFPGRTVNASGGLAGGGGWWSREGGTVNGKSSVTPTHLGVLACGSWTGFLLL